MNLETEKIKSLIDKINFEHLMNVLLIVLFTYIVLFIIRVLVEKVFKHTEFIEVKKKETMVALIKNTTNYIVLIVFLISLLKPYINIKDLLVAGGVIGIVIGFGAQSLIKDFLYGFFFLFEGQFKKGDFVILNDSNEGGVVEDLGFRALKVRLFNGKLLTVSNGEIKKIVNANIEKRRIYESVVFSFREDPSKIKIFLEEFCEEMNGKHRESLFKEENGETTEEFKLFGLSSIGENQNGWNYRIVATLKEEEYIKVVQELKQELAEKIYKQNMKLSEQQLFYQTRANVK